MSELTPMKKSSFCLVAVAATLILFVSLLSFYPKQQMGKESQYPAVSTQGVASGSYFASEKTTNPVNAFLPGATTPKLSFSERLKKEDWRTLALDAKAHPENGGYLYATYVSGKCTTPIFSDKFYVDQRIQRIIKSSGTVSPNVLSAANRFANMCSSFAPGEALSILGEIKSLSQNGSDPFLRASDDLSRSLKSGNVKEIKESFLAALSLKDPNIVINNSSLQKVMMTDMSQSGRVPGDMWFDGKIYSFDTPEYSTLSAAIDMINCSPNTFCESDYLMLLSCIGGHACGSNSSEYLKEKFVDEKLMNETQFTDAKSLAQKMREALERGDIGAFAH